MKGFFPISVRSLPYGECKDNLADLFEDSVRSIEAEYSRLEHLIGWRFLMGPRATLSANTQIALLSLNPGGHAIPVGHPCASRESGCAYFDEQWADDPAIGGGTAILQQQIRALCGMLQQEIGDTLSLGDFMARKILSACFVPFRSPDIERLPRRRESFEFAERLWTPIFLSWLPRVLVVLDVATFKSVQRILKRVGLQAARPWVAPTGWGNRKCEIIRYEDAAGAACVWLGRLPHLSRYALLGSPKRDPCVREWLSQLCVGLRKS